MSKYPKRTTKVKCFDCKRDAIKNPDLYFIHWLTGLYTCFDCLETAYFQVKLDIASHKRSK